MSGGGVIIARNLWDDPAFQNEPFSEREAWVWMICEASWRPRQKRVGKVIVDLERGQFSASVRFMAEAFSWHRNKADRFLKRLKKCNLIDISSGTGVNVVTICKYEEYQLSPKSSGTAAGQQRDSSGTNENKGNKGNNVKEATASLRKRKSPAKSLPRDWVPDLEMAARIKDELSLTREEMNYCYHQMKGHAHATDRRQANWDQAFGNWLRKAANDGEIGPNSKSRRDAGRTRDPAFD